MSIPAQRLSTQIPPTILREGFYTVNRSRDRTCYAYDQITGEKSSIALGLDSIKWLTVRGFEVAFRSDTRTEPLLVWSFGNQHVQTIYSLPMFGPLSFHPTQDIISIYDVYRARGGAYVGRWTPFNYGDLTALPMPVVQEQIRAAASQIIEITIPRRSSESSITSELSITSNIIIMEGLGDGTYPLVNGLPYGLKPY